MKQNSDRNLVLIGFMGCGKSAAACMLGKHYHMQVVEMDEIIAQEQGMSIPEIFKLHGEEYFRDLESELLERLQNRKGYVISCGGGVPLRDENVKIMKKIGLVVLLTASPETIYSRTRSSNDRPNLKDRKNPAAIAELLEQRRPKYEAAADFILATDDRSISDVCSELIRLINGDQA